MSDQSRCKNIEISLFSQVGANSQYWGSRGCRFESCQPDQKRWAVDLEEIPGQQPIFDPGVDLSRKSTVDQTVPWTSNQEKIRRSAP
jgi:hypothetical protein